MINIKIVNKSGLSLPSAKTDGAACVDICIIDGCDLKPGETKIFKTGLFVEIPKGWALAIVARSSLHKCGLILANGFGIIDSDYRGEIGVPLHNMTDRDVHIEPGFRPVQAFVYPINTISWIPVDSLSSSARGDGGFGSTGF